MTNNKYKKDLYSFWATKTQSKAMQDAIADDDVEKACSIFRDIFKTGLVEKR